MLFNVNNLNLSVGPIGDIISSSENPTAPAPPKLTVMEYDLQQLAKLQNELFCEVLSTSFLHFGTKVRPLTHTDTHTDRQTDTLR